MGRQRVHVLSWGLEEIGSRPLGLARVMVGVAALIRSYLAWRVLTQLTDPDVIQVPFVDWLPAPGMPMVVGIVVVWIGAAVAFILGWKVPVSGPILSGVILLTLFTDQQLYGNHLYLMSWLVLLLTVADAGAGINYRRVDRVVVQWPAVLVMAQASIVYGFSAVTKFNDSFLSGEVLASTLGAGLLPFPEALRTPVLLSVVAATAVFVELFIAFFLWSPRFRPAAFALGFGLHLSITLLMEGTLELVVFSLQMLALYPLFLPKEKLRLIWDDDCGSCRDWVRRLGRLDLLHEVEPVGKRDPQNPVPSDQVEHAMHAVDGPSIVSGFNAVTRTLERLVPTLWFAPFLRLPGLRYLGERWYRWQARRRSCPAAFRSPTTSS